MNDCFVLLNKLRKMQRVFGQPLICELRITKSRIDFLTIAPVNVSDEFDDDEEYDTPKQWRAKGLFKNRKITNYIG